MILIRVVIHSSLIKNKKIRNGVLLENDIFLIKNPKSFYSIKPIHNTPIETKNTINNKSFPTHLHLSGIFVNHVVTKFVLDSILSLFTKQNRIFSLLSFFISDLPPWRRRIQDKASKEFPEFKMIFTSRSCKSRNTKKSEIGKSENKSRAEINLFYSQRTYTFLIY